MLELFTSIDQMQVNNIVMGFNGVWISPTGDRFYTGTIQSHMEVISKLKLTCELSGVANASDNNDLIKTAMRIGWIRISSFMNQVGVEYGDTAALVKHCSVMTHEISQLIANYARDFMITIEKFDEPTNYRQVTSLRDFDAYIQSLA